MLFASLIDRVLFPVSEFGPVIMRVLASRDIRINRFKMKMNYEVRL